MAACAAFLVVASQRPAAAEEQAALPERIDWTIAPSGGDSQDQVQFSLSYRTARSHGNWSNTTRLSELQGLDPAQLAAASGTDVISTVNKGHVGRFCVGESAQRV